jgi:hypothetical protein
MIETARNALKKEPFNATSRPFYPLEIFIGQAKKELRARIVALISQIQGEEKTAQAC